MPSTSLIYTFLGIDAGAGAQLDRMAAKTGVLSEASKKSLFSMKAFGVGAAIAVGTVAVASVKMAMDFQASTERMRTQAHDTQAQTDAMRAGILSMAGAVASTPMALADAAYHIASVGQNSLTTAQQLQVLRLSAEGAKVGGSDLTDTTNALDAAIVSGIKGAQNYTQAMGVLNSTVGAGDMTMQNLADALSTGVLPVVKGYGVTLQQTGAALAVFGDDNIRGAKAGTQFRMAVQALAVPLSTGQAILQGWGDSAGNLQRQLRQGGLPAALQYLNQLFKQNGVTAKQTGDQLTEIFGKRAGTGISVLMEQLDRFQNKMSVLGAGAGSFAADWTAYTHTASYAFDSLRSSVDSLLIKIGDGLLPTVTAAMNYLSHTGIPAVERFFSAIAHNSTVDAVFSNIEHAVAAVAGAIGDAWRGLEPFVATIGKIAGIAVVGALDALSAAFRGIAVAVEAVTGWLSRNQMAMGAIAGLLTAALLPALTKLGFALLGMVTRGFVAAVSAIADFVAGLTGAEASMLAAESTAEGVGAAMSSAFGPLGLVLAGVGAVIGVVTMALHGSGQAAAAAKQGVDSWVQSLTNMPHFDTSITEQATALGAVIERITETRNQYAQLEAQTRQAYQAMQTGPYSGGRTGNAQAVAEQGRLNDLISQEHNLIVPLTAAQHTLSTGLKNTTDNVKLLSATYNLNQRQVMSLASANNIDLRKSYSGIVDAFDSAYKAAEASHHPLAQAAADIKTLGVASTSTSMDVQQLTDAFNNLVGNKVSLHQQMATFYSDLQSTKQALAASNHSLKLQSTTGNAAAQAWNGLVTQVGSAIEAQAGVKGVTKATVDQLKTMIDALKKIAPANAGAKQEIAGLTTLLRNLTGQMNQVDGSAKNAGKGTSDAMSAMAQQIQDKYGQMQSTVGREMQQLTGNLKQQVAQWRQDGTSSGQAFTAGVYAAIHAGVGSVASAAAMLGEQAYQAMKNSLHIHSPSKKTYYLGQMIVQGLIRGFTDQAQTARDALDTHMQDILNGIQSKIQAIQKKWDALVKKAHTTYQNELQAEHQFEQQLASTIMGQAALSNATQTITNPYSGVQTTGPSNVKTFLQGQEKQSALFLRDLRKLHHAGLSTALLDQLEQMGPAAALPYMTQLLSGSDGSMRALNRLQKEIAKQAREAADIVGHGKYGAKVEADRKAWHDMAHDAHEQKNYIKNHLAPDIGREVAKALTPIIKNGKITGYKGELTPKEIHQIDKELRKLHRTAGTGHHN